MRYGGAVTLSPGGLRLDGTFALMVGDAVVIQLASGRDLAGRVAWSLGATVGVEFRPGQGNENLDFLQLIKYLGLAIPPAALSSRT